MQRPTPTLFFEDRSIHNRSGEIAANNPGGKARVTRSGNRTHDHRRRTRPQLWPKTPPINWRKKKIAERVEVVSLGFIKPLDRETIFESVRKTGKALIVQDEPPWWVMRLIFVVCSTNFRPEALTVTPRIICGADEFLPYWDERPFLPSVESSSQSPKN